MRHVRAVLVALVVSACGPTPEGNGVEEETEAVAQEQELSLGFVGRWAYRSDGVLNGAPYNEVGVLTIPLNGNATVAAWNSTNTASVTSGTCSVTSAAPFITLSCTNATLGNLTYTLTGVLAGTELRLTRSGTLTAGEDLGRRQISTNYGPSQLTGTFGFSSSGTLAGAPYSEAGTLTFGAGSTIVANEVISSVALGSFAVTSSCTYTLASNGLSVASCTNSQGTPYNVYVSIARAGQDIFFFGQAPGILLGIGTGGR